MKEYDFSGEWSGYYTVYYENNISKDFPFKINMQVLDGVLKGTCIDDESIVVFDEPAKIDGFIEDCFISFIKRYPHAWAMDENGNPIKFKDVPSFEIHYAGNFENGIFSGYWELSIEEADKIGEANNIDLQGAWQMQRT
jgi:hypothetical protein